MEAFCRLCIVLSIAVAVVAYDECPEGFVKPCECVKDGAVMKVQCSNFSDLHALQAVFDKSVDRPFSGFILKDSSVMYLNASWLPLKHIKDITIRNSSLTGLFDRTPDTNDMVVKINLYDVRLLRGVEWEHFKNLKNVREIVMEGVDVLKIGKSFVDNVPSTLKKLSLTGSKTREMNNNVFQKLNDMETFELRNATVTTMKRSMFPKMIWLITFDLTNNLIESLPDDMFNEMPRLRYIYLSGNKLKTLPEKVFRYTYQQSVFEFKVEGNPIVCDCEIAWIIFAVQQPKVKGKCSVPDKLKDRELLSLTKEEFNYCPKAI